MVRRMTRILISETTACALVSLPPVVPHLGKAQLAFVRNML